MDHDRTIGNFKSKVKGRRRRRKNVQVQKASTGEDLQEFPSYACPLKEKKKKKALNLLTNEAFAIQFNLKSITIAVKYQINEMRMEDE